MKSQSNQRMQLSAARISVILALGNRAAATDAQAEGAGATRRAIGPASVPSRFLPGASRRPSSAWSRRPPEQASLPRRTRLRRRPVRWTGGDMKRSMAVLILVPLGVLPLQQARQLSDSEREIAGCYILEIGTWTERQQSKVPSFALPGSVELGLEAVGSNWFRLSPPIPEIRTRQRGTRWPIWYISDQDSLHLVWSTGFVGVAVITGLTQSDSVLVGYAKSFNDVMTGDRLPDGSYRRHQESTAPASLKRVRCP